MLVAQGARVVLGAAGHYEEAALLTDTFARMVAFAMSQPEDVDINEIP